TLLSCDLSPCSSLLHPLAISISTLSLHDALPISRRTAWHVACPARRAVVDAARQPSAHQGIEGADRRPRPAIARGSGQDFALARDRKSTRLNSSHVKISYAVFCLKKKTKKHSARS